jgi:hypothetical protein
MRRITSTINRELWSANPHPASQYILAGSLTSKTLKIFFSNVPQNNPRCPRQFEDRTYKPAHQVQLLGRGPLRARFGNQESLIRILRGFDTLGRDHFYAAVSGLSSKQVTVIGRCGFDSRLLRHLVALMVKGIS